MPRNTADRTAYSTTRMSGWTSSSKAAGLFLCFLLLLTWGSSNMAGEYTRFVKGARNALSVLDSPHYRAEADAQDLSPGSMRELQESLRDPRHQSPLQQQILGDELKRVQALQTMQLKRAAQAMPQQLQMSLSPAKTGEPWPSPEATMIRLMLQMQRRYPGMQGGPAPQPTF